MLILYFSIISHQRPWCGVVGRAFVHEGRRPGRQRAVDDVGVAGDPADVGRAPVDVLVADVEHPLHRLLGVEVVAGRGVLDALRLAGRAAGVEDEQQVFRCPAARRGNRPRPWPSGRATRSRGLPSSSRRSRSACTTMHFSTVGDLARAASTLAFSGICLPRRQPASAVICSLALASLLRSAMASAAKPPKITEWTAPIRAQASMAMASSGIIGMYIDTTSPLLDAQLLQHVGELAHFVVQHLVGVARGRRPARLPK